MKLTRSLFEFSCLSEYTRLYPNQFNKKCEDTVKKQWGEMKEGYLLFLVISSSVETQCPDRVVGLITGGPPK